MRAPHKSAMYIIIAIVVFAVAAAIVLARPSTKQANMSAGQMQQSSNSGTSAKPAATDSVTIQGFAFTPAAISVKAGTAVTWVNQDAVEHTVTQDSGSSSGPDSQPLAKGQTYSFTFAKAGTYHYHCSIHPDMKGTVIVTD